ncbi:MAG: arsenate reductase (glutaredoxin) [Beijerinckiaceae bacterium]|nr:arsenate reductase (glutaredoxin) [Beijerinckiaceae bacterium]MDO9443256.1 arsenate reductase (glutaredoxin) [Beijerinckiaceae bacterium]
MRIYHNPACGTSRAVLTRLREAGVEPEIVEYLKTPPSKVELKALLTKLSLEPRDILRRKGTTLETLGMEERNLDPDDILDAIAKHPILLERPIVVMSDLARICRPAEVVEQFLTAQTRKSAG